MTKKVHKYSLKALCVVACISIFALPSCSQSKLDPESPPKVSDNVMPTAIIDIVYARPFSLTEGYKYDWNQERPLIKNGTLAVLKVKPELVMPRNALERVLYVGNQSVQRLNHGDKSGHVIVIIPGDIDLSQAPIWFGSPGLPERITAKIIKSERVLADRADIKPFAKDKILTLTKSSIEAKNLSELLREHVADLVLEYSPQEKPLAEKWRLPVAQP